MTEDKTDEKQKRKDNANTADITRLKRAWERLKRRQAFVPLRKARIYSVDIVDDGKGGKKLRVRMSDGGKFNDTGDKRNLFRAMDKRRKHSFARLMSLVAIARTACVDTVASDLPPRVRRAFMRIYRRHVGNEMQQMPENKREDESLNQKLQNIAAARRQSFIENAVVQNLMKEQAGR